MRTGGTSYQRDRVCHVGILGEGGGERTFKYRSYATVEHTLAEEVLLLVALGQGHGGLCNVYRVVCERCDGGVRVSWRLERVPRYRGPSRALYSYVDRRWRTVGFLGIRFERKG